MATKTILRPTKVKVNTRVETFNLPSGSQARVVTRTETGQFVSTTPLTEVNPR